MILNDFSTLCVCVCARANISTIRKQTLLHVGGGGVWDFIYDSTANQEYMLYQIIVSFSFTIQ